MNDPPTLLVIEDDAEIRWAMRTGLEAEGYKVVSASNGEDALRQLRAGLLPNLIVLDYLMPVMDGRQFLDEVGKDQTLARVPAVIVSASIGARSVAGAATVLRKPIDFGILLATVKRFTGDTKLKEA